MCVVWLTRTAPLFAREKMCGGVDQHARPDFPTELKAVIHRQGGWCALQIGQVRFRPASSPPLSRLFGRQAAAAIGWVKKKQGRKRERKRGGGDKKEIPRPEGPREIFETGGRFFGQKIVPVAGFISLCRTGYRVNLPVLWGEENGETGGRSRSCPGR